MMQNHSERECGQNEKQHMVATLSNRTTDAPRNTAQSQNSLLFAAGVATHRHIFRVYGLNFFVSLYPRRSGKIHFIQVLPNIFKCACSNMYEFAPLFESERTDIETVTKGEISNKLNTPRNGYFLETATFKTKSADSLQLRA